MTGRPRRRKSFLRVSPGSGPELGVNEGTNPSSTGYKRSACVFRLGYPLPLAGTGLTVPA